MPKSKNAIIHHISEDNRYQIAIVEKEEGTDDYSFDVVFEWGAGEDHEPIGKVCRQHNLIITEYWGYGNVFRN